MNLRSKKFSKNCNFLNIITCSMNSKAVVNVINNICKALDFSKALDLVDYKILIEKLY